MSRGGLQGGCHVRGGCFRGSPSRTLPKPTKGGKEDIQGRLDWNLEKGSEGKEGNVGNPKVESHVLFYTPFTLLRRFADSEAKAS